MLAIAVLVCAAGCARSHEPAQQTAKPAPITLQDDVEPVRDVQQALPGVFIPPYLDCRAPLDDTPGDGPDGQVCTHVAISGCTQEGRYFPEYASCEVVRTQRPYWPASPAGQSRPDDPRAQDPRFMAELAWMTRQIEASGCTCCHDSRSIAASQWDIRAPGIWLDSLSDSGLALFIGLADSSVLGAYPAEDNHGFERARTGIPSTDPERMQAFLALELERRGISEERAAAVPPFGGPIYQNRVAKPTECDAEEGVDPDATVRWKGGPARYVYVTAPDSDNPGVPPNLDRPEGTRWRLDVRPDHAPLASGVAYGTTPDGTFQSYPVAEAAAPLQTGDRYRLYVLRDVGIPLANCVFVHGEPRRAPDMDASAAPADDGPAPQQCDASDTDPDAFGKPCSDARTHRECSCPAPYCAIQPGQTTGYCTATGCLENAAACPSDWSCFDLAQFQPGAPSVCLAP